MTASPPQHAAEASASHRRRLTATLRPWAWPVAVGSVVTALYTVYAAWQWSIITVKSWDLAIFTQLLQQYAALRPPIVTVKGDGFNLLGDHFHPLLAVLAPVYAVFPHAFTLIVIENVCFGIAAAVITWGAWRVLGPVAAVLFGLAFGLSWGLQSAVEVQFHEIALAVPLLAASLVCLLTEKWLAAALWAAPLVFVKEDLGLTVFAFGIVLAVRSRHRIGIWLAIWGLAWFALTAFVILPLLNPDGAWQYGGSVNPLTMFNDPAGLFAASKFETLLLLLLVTAGIAMRSPIVLILLPTLAWRFLSTNYGYWGPTWHYSAVLMPIAFVATLDAIRLSRHSSWAWFAAYGRQAATVVVTVSLMLLPGLPLAGLVNGRVAEANPRADTAWAVLDAIPADASVETDIGLLSYVAEAHPAYWIGNDNPDPDCILLDRQAGGAPAEWGGVLQTAQLRHPDRSYELVLARDGYELACAP